ncbi:MAG: glycosyltransferase, partial [Anaerolineae bacterium]|nr:glycosyltransferase [Anaerolineae bacterium]
QRVGGALELVIIDSGSRDGTPELARAAGARVLTIAKRHFNHGRTRNRAIAETHSPYIVLTVQDALPDGLDWLATLCAPLLNDPSIAASYGMQVAPEHADPLARARSLVWQRGCPPSQIQKVASSKAFWACSAQERLEYARFDDVAACMRRSSWEALPFPSASYAEDLAWGVQAVLRGWRIAWVPEARVWHYHTRPINYELRRAFQDGLVRARWLGWPTVEITIREAAALLLEAYQTHLVQHHGVLRNPDDIRRALYGEREETRARPSGVFVEFYEEIINFTWGLVSAGEELYPGGELPEQLWPQAAAFATSAVIGANLGLVAERRRGLFWALLRFVLARGV